MTLVVPFTVFVFVHPGAHGYKQASVCNLESRVEYSFQILLE